MSAPTGAQKRRAAYNQAKAAGCTCRPDVASKPDGNVEVRHDPDCPMADSGQTALSFCMRNGTTMYATVDLTSAIDLALQSDAMVLSTSDGVAVVPDSIDVPPMMAEFADIERLQRNGRTVRICSIPDRMVASMMGGVR